MPTLLKSNVVNVLLVINFLLSDFSTLHCVLDYYSISLRKNGIDHFNVHILKCLIYYHSMRQAPVLFKGIAHSLSASNSLVSSNLHLKF